MIIDRVDFREVKKMSFAQAETVADKVIGLFEQGEFDVCTLFYSEFKSVISQVPTAQQLIPASSSAADGEANASAIYDYEPSAEDPRGFAAAVDQGADLQGAA
jgi:F-type H+-transporting ATPase subunit gamma